MAEISASFHSPLIVLSYVVVTSGESDEDREAKQHGPRNPFILDHQNRLSFAGLSSRSIYDDLLTPTQTPLDKGIIRSTVCSKNVHVREITTPENPPNKVVRSLN